MEPDDCVALGLESLLEPAHINADTAVSFATWSQTAPAAPAQDLFQQQHAPTPTAAAAAAPEAAAAAAAFGVLPTDDLLAQLLQAQVVMLGATGSSLPLQQQQQPFISEAPVSDSVLDLVADLQLFEQQMVMLRRRVQQLAVNISSAGRLASSWPEAQQQQGKHPASPSTKAHMLLPDLAAAGGSSSREFTRCAGRLSVPGLLEPRPATPDKETERQRPEFPLHAAAQLCPNPDTWDVEPTWLAPCQGSQTEALQVDEAPPSPEEVGHQGGGGVTGSPGVQHERPGKPAGTYCTRRRIAAQRKAQANAQPLGMAKALRNAARALHRVQTAETALGVAPPGAGVGVCRMVRLLEQGACPEDLAEAVAQLVLAHVQHKQAQEALPQVEQMQWGVKCIMHLGSKSGWPGQPQAQREGGGGLMAAADSAVQPAGAAGTAQLQQQQEQMAAVAQLAAQADGALFRV